MKAGVLAIAAAIATGVAADNHHARRHDHAAFHAARWLSSDSAPEATCGCTTVYYTTTGEATLYFPPAPSTSSVFTPSPVPTTSTTPVPPPVTFSSNSSTIATPTPTPTPSTSSTPSPLPTTHATPSSSPAPVVPTPFVTTCSTTGVYTIPATTLTITEETTVCAATSTAIPSSGTYTVGGVTTVVETATTVVCPYATTTTSAGEVTSTILTTTYVCPSAGTYTIAPLTTTYTESTVWVYPTPASYPAGTYTQPEVVTTVTETGFVFFCPFSTPTPSPAPVLSTSPAPAPPAISSPAISSPAAPSPVASSPSASSPAPVATSSPASSGSNNGQLGTAGPQWAITYTPYANNGNCKSASDVDSDIADIASKGFTSVRVYSTDCSSLENIGAACKAHGLKMILGVFISDTGCSGAEEQVSQIISWAQWPLVELIVIGNEAVLSGYATASELAGFISSSASKFQAAGYNGPYTTTEPLNIWQENTETLCAVVDVVGCNIHPFFNPAIDAEHAGSFVASQLKLVDALCPGKYGINLETGWPSGGICNGIACPGASEQATAIKGITAAAGGKSVMFSYSNDEWKAPGQFDCEQSWGAIQLFTL